MQAVLGIDAAWTITNPSGVAVVAEDAQGWRLIAAAGSYRHFEALAHGGRLPEPRAAGSRPDPAKLLDAAAILCGRPVDLVAVDMPLARGPIIGRRASDNAVSAAYGARRCATHSPSALRPGRLSDDLRLGFERSGYPLHTGTPTSPGLIEVYPHPALVELAASRMRLPYKLSRISKYWPELAPTERKQALRKQWLDIVRALDKRISGVADALTPLAADARAIDFKAYEDKLDAIVCAWVAICVLRGDARAFGDDHSAIWIPADTAKTDA